MRTKLIALVLTTALAVAACGEDSSVGSDELLEGGVTGETRLGETTTTTTEAPVAAQPQEAAPTTAAPTTAPPETAPPTTEAVQQVSLEVAIQPDSAGNQFEPRIGRVFVGSIIRFTNTDSVPRSVEADSGAFSSGPIAPGASWDYTASTPGSFNYTDGTRPYAVGTLEVVAS